MIIFAVPTWKIYLFAPQYPEGLSLTIWLTKITGNVDSINNLNHYIGMKPISREMFPEFDFLVYIAGAYIAFGLLVSVTGSKKLLLVFLIAGILGGAAALADFYRWGYDYGHHLDPGAAIKVPGMSYQPPLIGHKQLLNFDAYSYPAAGAWIFLANVVMAGIILFFETYRIKRMKITRRAGAA